MKVAEPAKLVKKQRVFAGGGVSHERHNLRVRIRRAPRKLKRWAVRRFLRERN